MYHLILVPGVLNCELQLPANWPSAAMIERKPSLNFVQIPNRLLNQIARCGLPFYFTGGNQRPQRGQTPILFEIGD